MKWDGGRTSGTLAGLYPPPAFWMLPMPPRLYLYHRLVAQFRSQLPEMRLTQLRTLCLLVLGVTLAQHVSLTRMAHALPLPAHPLSTERRLRRWLGNPRVDPEPIWQLLRRQVLDGPAHYRLVLDLTPMNAQQQIVCLGVLVGPRVLPLAVQCVPLRAAWDTPLSELWATMVATVARQVPPGSQVTLLADRGLVGPGIITPCTNAGWGVVLRLKTEDRSRVLLADGVEVGLADWIAQHPTRWSGPVRLFKKAGWLAGWLTIWHEAGQAEPWVLFSTTPGGAARVRDYRCRMRIEATFQDLKRRGFHLNASGLQAADRIERLWLVVSLALWWMHQIGARVIKAGQRAHVDRPDERRMSWLKLGWWQLHCWLESDGRSALPLPFWAPPPSSPPGVR